jgi:hypothetical protein
VPRRSRTDTIAILDLVAGPIEGADGELLGRLIEALDDPAPQIRAVVTTLLVKGLDAADPQPLIELMVRSDGAARIADPTAAAAAANRLTSKLLDALTVLTHEHGERTVVTAWRDHLLAQMERWAVRAVDDADNRRRAERFLLFADNPAALANAQRRGFLLGMNADDLRALARSRSEVPVSPETATKLWAERDGWIQRMADLLGDEKLDAWDAARALRR